MTKYRRPRHLTTAGPVKITRADGSTEYRNPLTLTELFDRENRTKSRKKQRPTKRSDSTPEDKADAKATRTRPAESPGPRT